MYHHRGRVDKAFYSYANGQLIVRVQTPLGAQMVFVCNVETDGRTTVKRNYICFTHQDGRVVKALDLSSNGRMSAWVRSPHLTIVDL